MGGYVQSIQNEESNEESTDSVLIHVREAGHQYVNGTYRRHHGDPKNKYTSIGRYEGQDVEYYIELRIMGGKKMWYLCCQTGNPSEPPIDFYRAKVNERCAYPSQVKWVSASLHGTFPAPKNVSVSHFG